MKLLKLECGQGIIGNTFGTIDFRLILENYVLYLNSCVSSIGDKMQQKIKYLKLMDRKVIQRNTVLFVNIRFETIFPLIIYGNKNFGSFGKNRHFKILNQKIRFLYNFSSLKKLTNAILFYS